MYNGWKWDIGCFLYWYLACFYLMFEPKEPPRFVLGIAFFWFGWNLSRIMLRFYQLELRRQTRKTA